MVPKFHMFVWMSCFQNSLIQSEFNIFVDEAVFSLTLPRSPMASRSYWYASDFFKLLARIAQ